MINAPKINLSIALPQGNQESWSGHSSADGKQGAKRAAAVIHLLCTHYEHLLLYSPWAITEQPQDTHF